ncbi:MAG TPA: hypothetical protein VIH57_14585 [Bacteroidales bacterium]
MARLGKNVVTTRLRGKVGDLLVFRMKGNKTYVSTAPEDKERVPSVAQKAQTKRFQEAIIYGKGVIADPTLKNAYQLSANGNQTAFNVAVADFLHAPQIDEVDVSKYTGKAGDIIRVRATDDFKVAQVQISIYNSDNTLVEEGLAKQQTNPLDWVYTITVNNPETQGDKIVIRASDLPGNLTQSERAI